MFNDNIKQIQPEQIDMETSKQAFKRYLNKKGIRHTEQRQKVLNAFLKTERHVTATELYELVRRRHPRIGYATVYRTMKIICDAGLARKIDFGEGMVRFEHKYGHEHHDHLVCVKCGRFIEIMSPEIESLQKKVTKEHGFTPISHKMQIFGLCKKCKDKKERQNSKRRRPPVHIT